MRSPLLQDSFFVFLNKPVGQTSQQCLTQFKRRFHCDKLGHHGTLDPFANGLLLAGTNEAAKFFRFVDDSRKTYEATLRFGARTDTLDRTGETLETRDVPDWSKKEIASACQPLAGKILQTPPMYSAIKMNGVKLYELARRGEEVEREARAVEIFSLEILEWKKPLLRFRAEVSRGTYVRVLAEQIAEKLGNVGHLTALLRTKLCGFGLEHAFSIVGEQEIPARFRIPIDQLLQRLPRVSLEAEQVRDLGHGKLVDLTPSQGQRLPAEGEVMSFHENCFLGIVQLSQGCLKVVRLMDLQRMSSE